MKLLCIPLRLMKVSSGGDLLPPRMALHQPETVDTDKLFDPAVPQRVLSHGEEAGRAAKQFPETRDWLKMSGISGSLYRRLAKARKGQFLQLKGG